MRRRSSLLAILVESLTPFAPYRLLEFLGEGGIGRVYAADQKKLSLRERFALFAEA